MADTYSKYLATSRNGIRTSLWSATSYPPNPDWLDKNYGSTSTVSYMWKEKKWWNVQARVEGKYPRTLPMLRSETARKLVEATSEYAVPYVGSDGVARQRVYRLVHEYDPGTYATVTEERPYLVSKAKINLSRKVLDAKANLGVTIGESRETFRWLSGRVKSIGGAILSFKKGKIRQGLAQLGFNSTREAKEAARRVGYKRRLNDVYLSKKQLYQRYLGTSERNLSVNRKQVLRMFQLAGIDPNTPIAVHDGKVLYGIDMSVKDAIELYRKQLEQRAARPYGGYGTYDRATSSAILEYSYAFCPVIKDIQDIAQTTADRMLNRLYRTVVKGRAKDEWEGVATDFDFTLSKSGLGTHPFIGVRTPKEVHSAMMWVRVRWTRPEFQTVNQWGLLNPLDIAWNLIPFSFVIDQVVSVGAYLASLTAFTGSVVEDYGGGYERRGIDTVRLVPTKGGYEGKNTVESVYYRRFNDQGYAPSIADLNLELQGIWRNFISDSALAHSLIRGR